MLYTSFTGHCLELAQNPCYSPVSNKKALSVGCESKQQWKIIAALNCAGPLGLQPEVWGDVVLLASACLWSLVMVRQSRHAPHYAAFPLGTFKVKPGPRSNTSIAVTWNQLRSLADLILTAIHSLENTHSVAIVQHCQAASLLRLQHDALPLKIPKRCVDSCSF